MTADDKKNRLQSMEQTAPLLGLLAELLARFDIETVVAQPMADDFPETVPANYWPMEESRDE
jgi:hypothetical protein